MPATLLRFSSVRKLVVIFFKLLAVCHIKSPQNKHTFVVVMWEKVTTTTCKSLRETNIFVRLCPSTQTAFDSMPVSFTVLPF